MLHDIARRCQLPANTPAQDPNLSGQTHMVPGTLVPQQPSGGHGTAQGAFSNKVLGRGAVLTRAREQGREPPIPMYAPNSFHKGRVFPPGGFVRAWRQGHCVGCRRPRD